MIEYLADLCASLGAYALLAAACIGWGRLGEGVLGIRLPGAARVFHLAWLGLAVSLGLFQAAHFLVPIAAPVALAWLGGGVVAGLVLARRDLPAGGNGEGWRPAAFAIALGAVAVWLGSRAMAVPDNYDSGLYHFQVIRWIREFPVVPGLGNLHSRYAFNVSFFPAVAAWDVHPLWGHGRNVAVSFLFLLLIAECLHGAARFFRARRRSEPF